MCKATVGATPVKRCTSAASATFSYGSRGTPCWANTLNLVPEFPNARTGARSAGTEVPRRRPGRLSRLPPSPLGLSLVGCLVGPIVSPHEVGIRPGRRSQEGGRRRSWRPNPVARVGCREACHTFRLVSIAFLTIALRYCLLCLGKQSKPSGVPDRHPASHTRGEA